MPNIRRTLFSLGRAPTTAFDWVQTVLSHIEGTAASGFMISFDDGPHPLSTPYILDTLKTIKNRDGLPARAGFFLVGEDKSRSRRFDIWSGLRKGRRVHPSTELGDHGEGPSAESYPELVRAIEKEGHYSMVHSQHHRDLNACTIEEMEAEIIGCHETLVAAGARPYRYFRPPYLSMPKIPRHSRLFREGWVQISGVSSGDTHPWATEGSVVRCCMRRLKRYKDPVVLIFHDFRGLPAHRLDFGAIFRELTKAGYAIEDFAPERLCAPLSLEQGYESK